MSFLFGRPLPSVLVGRLFFCLRLGFSCGLSWLLLFFSLLFELLSLDFLEVQSLHKRLELRNRLVEAVVNEAVSKEDGVVGQLNLFDRVSDAHFESCFILNAVSNAFSQIFKGWRVDEAVVAFLALFVQRDGALHIHLDNWYFACLLDALQFGVRSAVECAANLLLVFNEFSIGHHLLELCRADKNETIFILFMLTTGTSCVRSLFLEKVAMFLQSALNESVLADTRGAHQDQGLVLLGRRVEGVEILLRVHEDIILQTHSG